MKRKTGLFFLFLALVFFVSCHSREEAARPTRGDPEFRAQIRPRQASLRSFEGETAQAILNLKNKGKREWTSAGKNPVLLSYHLLSKTGTVLKFDNLRTPLPRALRPGEEIDAAAKVKMPLEPGSYLVEFDLVREGVSWFKDQGGRTLLLPLIVEARRWPEDESPLELSYGKYTNFRSSVAEFEKFRRLIRLTLDHDVVEFPGKTGKIMGFTAGAGYPQIWLRDAATIIPASRYFYPEPFLTSWLEEHLAFARADGSLEDWIDSQGRSDKNTVETDQEASAVQAAYQIFLLRGADSIEKRVDGEAVIDRLERALLSVFRNRLYSDWGLITGAHTADWGDVDPEDADQKAIYVDEKTRWTADIYDQSMCYQACLELASMFSTLHRTERAAFWERQAATLRDNANRRLWQEDKGFYRVHLHLEPWKHDFDEAGMFAMGGNAQAIISGLARPEQAKRIIETALLRQQKFGVSTLSGSLLPPYPARFFKHPAMDEPYEYQNGGQWDWFGGRLVYAMFETGFSVRAKEKLLEMVKKNFANGGIFEWDTKDGAGRGSDYYAGSAGSLARALFEGYFGLKLEKKRLVLEPKLGEDEALVHFYLPAADLSIAYEHRPFREEKRIVFRYRSNFPASGKIRILMPRAMLGFADTEEMKKRIRAFRDGKSVAFSWLSRNEDDFVVLDTDFRDHTLEIRAIAK
ncbi:MAG: hypothetical protein AB1715_10140 [Acidobacteriota bacterium]